ncbi:A-agglutinin anchorage subunit [Scaptodrosophila lebanonensis]|uniref:A-agglutinin anchorage subunit n=1 Tax=Drosophila lebanonensis TaxID=7225 RepID=A0A6J2TCL9_DROLE|nr:A-agglutinin anchorage subunit [Scaptodrosophila lebanonensis]
MKCALVFTLFAALMAFACAAPFNLNDIFPGFLGNAKLAQPVQQPEPVKRQVHVEANPDAELKQISLNNLIGNLENSLFQSALSVNGASAPDSVVAEIKPAAETATSEEHAINKRSEEETVKALKASTDSTAVDDKIIVQTTKKVPIGEDGKPAHLIIDRVSVQPHSGGVALIPTFQVHHTKLVSATIKEDPNSESSDGKQTKISITKTSITSTAPVEAPEVSSSSSSSQASTTTTQETSTTTRTTTVSPSSTTTVESEESSTTTSPSTTASSSSSSTTSEQPILKLEKVEEKLKEKVAEVEAEPIILSSRV